MNQKSSFISPFDTRTKFNAEGIIEHGSGISRPHTQWLQTAGNLLNSSAQFVAVPASATAEGKPNEFSYDLNFLYFCVAPNVWRRTALVAW